MPLCGTQPTYRVLVSTLLQGSDLVSLEFELSPLRAELKSDKHPIQVPGRPSRFNLLVATPDSDGPSVSPLSL